MATSPLFGWEEPDDTDLVKDGAAAIRTLGNAIDSSMGDLLGGTTGQVLSKNSNTNMDFTWVTSDDANAIQNTIVDAKGDLIAASASDVPARLAVGTNNQYLIANSTTATGLSYGGAITSWTPTFSNLSVGNGSVTAEYQQVGSLVFCYISIVLGSTSTVTGDVNFTVPVTTIKRGYMNGTVLYQDTGVTTAAGTMEFAGNNAYFRLGTTNGTYLRITDTLTATVPWTWGNTDRIDAYFYYEVNL